MPVMTGIEFYEQLMARDPAQAGRVAFMTGGAVNTGKDEAFLCSVPTPRLDKPFGVPAAHRVGGTLSGRVSV
jgi:CheY-like chemotaxis protein